VADTAQATLCVPAGHAIFEGHFPGMPLVPGVMLLEWTLREAAHLLGVETHELRLRESKFFLPLKPEETAELFLKVEARTAFRICRGADLLASGVLEKS
jgi:3-hydroxyacyl-[acyl-carrier-protein] dehydratase